VFSLTPPVEGNTDSGWNLLGNPYASTIAWSSNTEAWPRENVSPIVAIRNNFNTTTGQFEYFDAISQTGTGNGGTLNNGKIGPGQAFWVQSINGGTPTLAITEKAKVAEQQTFFRDDRNPANHLKLYLSAGSKSDGAVLVLSSFASDTFEAEYDGLKRKNEGIFNFSTLTSDGVAVAINHTGTDFCSRSIALSIADAAPGTYVLSVESVLTLSGINTLTLEDRFLHTSVNLMAQNDYSFSITADPATSGSNRFVLHLDRPALGSSLSSIVSGSCGEPLEITLKDPERGVFYAILDQNNNEVVSAVESTGQNLTLVLDPEKMVDGTNVVRVKAFLPGCTSLIVPGEISFNYYHPANVSVDDLFVCSGESAKIQARAPGTASSFVWFRDDEKIRGVEGSTLQTLPVMYEQYYSVYAVQPDGCAGEKAYATVHPVSLETPVIQYLSDTLFTTAASDEYEWHHDNVLVEKNSKNFFVPLKNGMYSVAIRSGDCYRISQNIEVDALNEPSDFSCSVYPNPALTGNFTIRFNSPDQQPMVLTIADLAGRLILRKVYSSSEWKKAIPLELSNKARKGVYIIAIEQGARKKIIKLIVN
jgi:hypothetical protein